MAQNVTFNKFGNLSFNGRDAIYRIPTEHLKSEDATEIERSIKRMAVGHKLEHQLLTPVEIENEGRYSLLKYDLSYLDLFDKLIEFSLREKLEYFRSLIAIAQEEKRGNLKVVWENVNFVVDKHENNIKVLMYETSSIPVFSDEDMNIVQRVKEMILLSLTRLNKIISLPKMIDLLEQDEINREFCQSLYHYDNLDDILYLIEETELRYINDEKEGEEDVKEEKSKRKFFKNTKSKNEKNIKLKKKESPVYMNPNRKNKKNSRFDKKTVMMLLAVVVIFIVYIAMELGGSGEPKMASVEDIQTQTSDATSTYFKSNDNKAITTSLLRAYRSFYSGRQKDAFTILETINKRDLDVSDLTMVIAVYDAENELATLLDSNPVPEMANEVITYLIKNDRLNRLSEIAPKMESSNPYIEFETAYMNADYKRVIELKDTVELNGRKEGQIVDAYLQLGQIQEATEFAQTVGNPDLFKIIDGYSTF